MESFDPMIQQRRSLTGFAKLIVLQPPETLPNQQSKSQGKSQEAGDRPSTLEETSTPSNASDPNVIQS